MSDYNLRLSHLLIQQYSLVTILYIWFTGKAITTLKGYIFVFLVANIDHMAGVNLSLVLGWVRASLFCFCYFLFFCYFFFFCVCVCVCFFFFAHACENGGLKEKL